MLHVAGMPNDTPANPTPPPHTAPTRREDQVIALVSAAIAGATAGDFYLGPAVPFIQFGRFLSLSAQTGISLVGKRCMDFGCGAARPFSISSIMYALGAETVTAIDVAPLGDRAAMAKGVYALVVALSLRASGLEKYPGFDRKVVASRLADFDLEALRSGDLAGGLPSAIRHVQGDYLELQADIGALDVVVSNSVFEHVPDLGSTLRMFGRNLRSGGVVYSDTDYRDHRQYAMGASPWQYLVDDGDHEPGYINKLRHTAMRELIANCGFDVVESVQVENVPPTTITQNLHPRHVGTSAIDLRVVQDTLLIARTRA